MKPITTIRASALPMAFACPGAARAPDLAINPSSEAADQGTAAHAVMRQIAEGDLRDIESIDLLTRAREASADPEELRIQALNGLWIWRQIRGSFPGARGEVDLKATIAGVEVTGHLDLFARDDRRANIADWKFGRVDKSYFHQLAGYMGLVLLTFPELEEVSAFVCWMREREVEPYTMTRGDLTAWSKRFGDEVVNWDGTYRPGKHCVYCPRTHECEALTAIARRDIKAISETWRKEDIERGLADLAPRDVCALYRRAGMLEALCKSLRDAIRRRVDDAGGVLPDGEGAELRFIETKKRQIDPLRAWPVLQARLTDEEIASAVSLSVSALDDLVAMKAGKGKGAPAKRALAADLEAAQAVTTVPSRQLRDMRTKGE